MSVSSIYTVSEQNIHKAKKWLTESVIPLWFTRGYDSASGSFVEAMTAQAEPLDLLDRRAMVQARQLYAVTEANKLGLLSDSTAREIVAKNIKFIIEKYKLPEGGFAHAVNSKLQISNSDVDLYTQAFVLFAMARAYELLNTKEIKLEALNLMEHLDRQRTLAEGGYTEIKSGKTLFQSNPHMHLYEALLEWVKVDKDSRWFVSTQKIKELCLNKFIDKKTGILAEHFETPWSPVMNNGRFIFEPGHHYEWAWLHLQYQQLTNENLIDVSEKLFLCAESHGISADKKYAFDEVWSDYSIHKSSARFWPQSERIKAALSLAICVDDAKKAYYIQAADLAFEGLFSYLNTPVPGLWFDSMSTSGSFENQNAKASSLYHIINALSEYINLRPTL